MISTRQILQKCLRVQSATRSWTSSRCISTSDKDPSAAAAQAEVHEAEDFDDYGSAPIQQKPERPPFVKELFLGRFDKERLIFPEVLEKERHETLHEMVEPIERFFEEQVDSEKIDREAKIPQETLDGLKELGLYGMQIPQKYGGLEMGATEFARLSEITALDGSIAVTLAAHQSIGLKGILIAGNEEQKQKYLPRLATGEWTAAFALTEPSSGSDAASIQTKATLADDGKTWLLNGGKIWISNGGYANMMTVFAKTDITDHLGGVKEKVTAFIVERDFGGVSAGKPEDKLGIRGSNTCQVFFDNTPVPMENVLGEVGGGFKVAMQILNSGRFSMGSSSAALWEKAIGMREAFHLVARRTGICLLIAVLLKCHFEYIKINEIYILRHIIFRVSETLRNGYRMNGSFFGEVKILKIRVDRGNLDQWGIYCNTFFGTLRELKSYGYKRVLENSGILVVFFGNNEPDIAFTLFIMVYRLQYAGIELSQMVKKLRNPLMNPGFIIGKGMENFRQKRDNPKLDLNLGEQLHPALGSSAEALEYCIKRFQYGVESVLGRHAKKVVDPANQLEIARLADCAIDLFGMTAVLGRASRSKSIGIRNSEHEIHLAMTFTQQASMRIKKRVSDLENGPFVCGDKALNQIADELFEHGGYVAEHPLTRTYW
ncbi:unnamed protein product, partial [Meganyctiphanes norvegica]